MNNEDQEFLETLKEEFFAEAEDSLDECEKILMNLESKSAKSEDVKNYKRILHSMKGSAHAVDLKKLAEALHKMEDLIQNGDEPKAIDLSLKFIDLIRSFVELARQGEDAKACSDLAAIIPDI